MALRLAMLKNAGGKMGWMLQLRRLAHFKALPSPLDASMASPISSLPPLSLPEFDQNRDKTYNNNVGFGFPLFPIGGSMELMDVPKKKELQSGAVTTLLLLQWREEK